MLFVDFWVLCVSCRKNFCFFSFEKISFEKWEKNWKENEGKNFIKIFVFLEIWKNWKGKKVLKIEKFKIFEEIFFEKKMIKGKENEIIG